MNPISSMFDRMGCRIPVLNGGHRKSGCLGQTKNRWGKVKMPEMVPEKWSQEVAIEVGGRKDGQVMGKICQPHHQSTPRRNAHPADREKNGQPILSRGGGVAGKRVSGPPPRNVEDMTKSRGLGGQNWNYTSPKKSVELPSGKVGWKWRP